MKKVLIVEDSKFLSNTFKTELGRSGYEIRVVGDGEEAMNTLKEFKPDLILLDLVMPKKDGFEVLSELKQSNDLKSIPVLVISILNLKEDMEKAISLGAVDYLTKTDFTLEELKKKVGKILKS